MKRVLALNRNFPNREVSVGEGAVGRKACALPLRSQLSKAGNTARM